MDRRNMLKSVGAVACVAIVLCGNLMAQYVIRTETAMQGFNPLNPTLTKHPVITSRSQTASQLLDTFTVTNYSDKTVSEIEYGWRIAAPYTCIDSNLKPQWDYSTVKVDLPPGKEIQIDADVKLSASGTSKAIADQASLHKTPVVLVTVGLLKVTYSDGTTWSDEEALTRQMFDGGMHEKLTECKATPKQTGKCDNGNRDPWARLNLDEISRKGGGGGNSCIARNCNVSQILNGTCNFAICIIECCGYGCGDACHSACEPYWLPWQCGEQYY